MGKFSFLKSFLKDMRRLIFRIGRISFLRLLNDKQFVKLQFKLNFGYSLDLDHPQTFNEKLNWIKVYDHNPIYTTLVDKYEVKKYVANMIGDKYVIPTLGVWDCFDDIDFNALPNQFVLKCTHDSGGVIVVADKSKLNIPSARKKINRSLKKNYYLEAREWPYKNVKGRVIAEKYMEDSLTHDLRDYKFFTFDGEVKAMFIATERYCQVETKFDFFDAEFNHLPFVNGHPNAEVTPSKPVCFEEMKRLASKLAKGFPQARVDFYEVDGQIYFGEITFFHFGGMVPFVPEQWDYTFGQWISLPVKYARCDQ